MATVVECPGQLCEVVAQLGHAMNMIRLTKLASAASLTLYLYDYVSTLDSEVNIMWKAQMGPGKVIYFLLRYYTLAFLIFLNAGLFLPEASSSVSIHWIRVHWISGIIIALLIDLMLQIRVYAFYGRRKHILAILAVAFVVTGGTMFTLACIIISKENASFLNLGSGSYMHMCVPSTLNSVYSNFFFVPLLADGTLIFVLVATKAFKNIRKYGADRQANQLTFILLEDSAMCFFATFTAYSINQLIWIIGSEDYIEFPVGFTVAIGSLSCQRLCLGFRKDRPNYTIATTKYDYNAGINLPYMGVKRDEGLYRI